MINKQGTLGIFPTFSTLILAVGLMDHVMVIPPLLQAAKRDAWVGVLASIPALLIWTAILFLIMKMTNQQPFLPWLKQHYGGFVCGIFRFFFMVYVFLIGTLTIKDTVMWTHTSYLPRTPIIALAIPLVLLCCIAAHVGIKAIAISSGILLPFVIIFGDFVMSSNLPAKNYSLLMPVFENGIYPVLQGILYTWEDFLNSYSFC